MAIYLSKMAATMVGPNKIEGSVRSLTFSLGVIEYIRMAIHPSSKCRLKSECLPWLFFTAWADSDGM